MLNVRKSWSTEWSDLLFKLQIYGKCENRSTHRRTRNSFLLLLFEVQPSTEAENTKTILLTSSRSTSFGGRNKETNTNEIICSASVACV